MHYYQKETKMKNKNASISILTHSKPDEMLMNIVLCKNEHCGIIMGIVTSENIIIFIIKNKTNESNITLYQDVFISFITCFINTCLLRLSDLCDL